MGRGGDFKQGDRYAGTRADAEVADLVRDQNDAIALTFGYLPRVSTVRHAKQRREQQQWHESAQCSSGCSSSVVKNGWLPLPPRALLAVRLV